MLKKQKFVIKVETDYTKSVVSKIKNFLWSIFEINPKIENFSFNDSAFDEVAFYFVASDESLLRIADRLKVQFDAVVESIDVTRG